MTLFCRIKRRHAFACVALLVATACERARTPPPTDTTAIKPAGNADSIATAQSRNWDHSAGPLLLVAADAPDRAFVVVPDSAAAGATMAAIPHPAAVTLFSRSGTVQEANLPEVADSGVCTVASLSAAPPPRTWNVGFIGGVISPLPLDSTESLSAGDSASTVVWLNRLASSLPNDPSGRFVGLPFVVRNIWRFTIPSGQQVVVANLARQINQEATPLQEATFLVAERAAGDTTYDTAYYERSSGAEETLQNRDVLAAVLIGANKNAAVVVARDFGDSIAYGVIERGDDGKWRARWNSARRHC